MIDLQIPIHLKESDSGDEFDSIFSIFYRTRRPVMMPVAKGWKPLTDVYETDEHVIILMDIAGISTSDVKLTLHENTLTVRGIRRENPMDVKRHYHKMEIDFGPFERKIELPARIDHERESHRYIHGFLEIRLPKLEPISSTNIDIEIDL